MMIFHVLASPRQGGPKWMFVRKRSRFEKSFFLHEETTLQNKGFW